MTRRLRGSNGIRLFRGQRRARRSHGECPHCERPICANEYYFCSIVLTPTREVIARKSCCKAV